MTNTTTNAKTTPIVCFHIGRGGIFNNPGHLSYIRGYKDNINNYTGDLFAQYEGELEISNAIDNFCSFLNTFRQKNQRENLREKFEQCQDSDDFSFFEKLGFKIGEKYYYNNSGASVGLRVDNDGTGKINIDYEYDTTYCKHLEDCDEAELQLIINDNSLLRDNALELYNINYADDCE